VGAPLLCLLRCVRQAESALCRHNLVRFLFAGYGRTDDEQYLLFCAVRRSLARVRPQCSGRMVVRAVGAIHDWLHHEFGIDKVRRALAEPHKLDADGFVTAVRAALPKSRKWSAAEIARLKQEHVDTMTPARNAAADLLALERRLSDLVNAAYGLTPEDVALMWRTAPPRMPLDPADELRRLAASRRKPAR
jgi:hypothetical protein